jgi:hypothetical protein
MESIDFLHAERIFTIHFRDDLTFVDVRKILDTLLSRNAFDPEVQQETDWYSLDFGHAAFSVWVSHMHVVIEQH